MKIVVGKLAGFCGGVKRSVLKAEECLNSSDKVYCYGEIVHNKQVINKLEEKGLTIVDDINEIPNDTTVIFRAHGVEKKIYDLADSKKLNVVDLTCPNVIKIHEDAEKLVTDGYFMILIAQVSHPETIGTISFCGENSFILEDESMLDELQKKVIDSGLKKIAVISQTTFSVSKYNMLVEKINELFKDYELNINNNICNATDLRQKEMKELSSTVDAMIVIGGKNSSNTKKLYEVATEACEHCYLVETVEELEDDFSKYNTVGVMAGASTPEESILEVVKFLEIYQ